eukprot:Nitzschia sp. Nitz4//scaffold107_size73032//57105//60498//NITZ4_005769-RA/size73032-augustus-gene-0.103-mRNA-1//-1//CDS//3329532620//4786//frame0
MRRVLQALIMFLPRLHSKTPLTLVHSFYVNPLTRVGISKSHYSSTSLRAAKAPRQKKPVNPFAPTILLPQTEFSQRANSLKREPEIQQFWKDYDLYNKLSENAPGPRYVLHDGPPYANGDLHSGHALNKILKDFINRKQVLNGKQVHYVPGWDCHGLPIELKVLQTLSSKERKKLTPVTLRQVATQFAKETVEKQSSDYQRCGLYGDFDHPYLTLQPEFEAAQIRVFGEMFQKGYIFRGRKPIHWSPSSRTALAEAELEYPEGHVSKSIYVAFPVHEPTAAIQQYANDPANPLKVAIWTTTPWTMPANMAIAVNKNLEYSIVEHPSTGRMIVATDLIETLTKKLKLPENESFAVLATLTGADIVGTTYTHSLYGRVSPVVEGGDYITTESGTGLVHTAPGHGQEDYQTGLKNGLEILSPVDDAGKFTVEAGEDLVGMNVLGEGNQAVIDKLSANGALLLAEDYEHKYPYDWRTKKPTIFRATDQWFASLEGFRDNAMEAIETVRWIPDAGKTRISSFVSGRNDWCISRQRSWGVPIPVFYDRETGKEVLLDSHTLDHIETLFAEQGSDAWFKLDEVDLLPECYKAEASKWKKGMDTMDVWFDSGSSWAGVCKGREELQFPADIYLEGSDQHRGWFQSSLLTSVAVNQTSPYKTVLTHGFVLDEKGFKMSKSLGNIVGLRHVIEGGKNKKKDPAYGADVLRLWAASVDYSGDVSIGPNIIQQTFENYRKLRNTARYLIGNLHDYVPEGEGSTVIAYDELPSLDKWMLGRLSTVLKEVDDSMENFQFQKASQELSKFVSADLSNFYLDVAKDRLYVAAVDDYRRRSCQTVIHALLEGFTKSIAPILPHMAEDIWQKLPYDKPTKSVFEGGWPKELLAFPEFDEDIWGAIRQVRDDINKLLEVARRDKLVGASLEAAAYIYAPNPEMKAMLESLVGDESLIVPPVRTNGVDELRTVLMLSQVHIVDSVEDMEKACEKQYISDAETSSGCIVGVSKAAGEKCGRCWFHDTQLGKQDLAHADACQRCNDAIESWEQAKGQSFERESADN